MMRRALAALIILVVTPVVWVVGWWDARTMQRLGPQSWNGHDDVQGSLVNP